ncbi:MAG: sulfatase-like hydrolase/transferase, partial [Pirellulaceae bacterium]
MLIPAPKRRRFRRSRPRSGALFVSVLLVAVLPAAWSARVVEGADRGNSPRGPNIIFILADDLGWGDLGCYGNRLVQTPELDRLAGQGTLFTQFYVCGSVCSPSRCAFFTGQYPARQRIHGHYATRSMNAARGMSQFLDPQVPNVARVLKSAGYATAHIGKWHLGSNSGGPDPAAYGFDFVGTGEREGANGPSGDRFFRARSTELFVDEALHFIREHREGPFYLQLWTLLTHATLNPTDAQMQRFARSSNPGIPHKSARTIYNASLFDLDQQIGRLLRELEALGLAERTVVVFSSDNGPEDIHIANAGHSGIGSAGPFRGRKRSLYEGGVRVPFLVRWPGQVRAGAVDDDSILAGVDLLPTLAGLAGATLPDTKLDGEVVGELWRGKPRARQQPLFWDWRFRIAGPIF